MSATKDQELLVAKNNLVILKIEVWEILLHIFACKKLPPCEEGGLYRALTLGFQIVMDPNYI
jgi:hypothetical protein